MKERAESVFPFAIACALPPAGLFLAIVAFSEEDRDLGLRLTLVALVAAAVWTGVVLSLQ